MKRVSRWPPTMFTYSDTDVVITEKMGRRTKCSENDVNGPSSKPTPAARRQNKKGSAVKKDTQMANKDSENPNIGLPTTSPLPLKEENKTECSQALEWATFQASKVATGQLDTDSTSVHEEGTSKSLFELNTKTEGRANCENPTSGMTPPSEGTPTHPNDGIGLSQSGVQSSGRETVTQDPLVHHGALTPPLQTNSQITPPRQLNIYSSFEIFKKIRRSSVHLEVLPVTSLLHEYPFTLYSYLGLIPTFKDFLENDSIWTKPLPPYKPKVRRQKLDLREVKKEIEGDPENSPESKSIGILDEGASLLSCEVKSETDDSCNIEGELVSKSQLIGCAKMIPYSNANFKNHSNSSKGRKDNGAKRKKEGDYDNHLVDENSAKVDNPLLVHEKYDSVNTSSTKSRPPNGSPLNSSEDTQDPLIKLRKSIAAQNPTLNEILIRPLEDILSEPKNKLTGPGINSESNSSENGETSSQDNQTHFVKGNENERSTDSLINVEAVSTVNTLSEHTNNK